MALLSALFSLLGRKLGDLLQAIFGWSITGLFGKLPSSKQTALTVALVLSLAWPLLVVGVAFPNIAAWALAFLPLKQWIGETVLRFVWLGLALIGPIVVGAITRWVAPSRKVKGGVLRTVVSGYPITIGFFCSFLVTLVVVPALKIGAMFRGWSDQHIYVQPREGQYRSVLHSLAAACEHAGLPLHEAPMPRAMLLATRILKACARGAVDAIVENDPRTLRGEGVELYLYPADLLLRGKKQVVARVRAALTRELMHAPAHLTTDPRAQEIEVELDRMWEVVDRHGGGEVHGLARARVGEIARELDRADVPFDDWVLLYTNLHRLEREVCGGPHLVDPKGFEPSGEAAASPLHPEVAMMMNPDPRPETDTTDLMKEALGEAKHLVQLEVALAKEEVKREASAAKTSAIAFGSSAVLALIGVTLLLVALALALFPSAIVALVIGGLFVIGAGVLGILGYKSIPKKPLDATKKRLETDVKILKERVA